MVSWRRPPTFMPGMPSIQPWIRLPSVRVASSGLPESHDESNCFPVEQAMPT